VKSYRIYRRLALCLALAAPLEAQRPATRPSPPDTVSSSRLTLARQLRSLMTVEGAVGTVGKPALIEGRPPSTRPDQEIELARRRWAERYMPADTIAEVEARAIAREFDERELRDLLSFFASPLGRRVVEAQPRLTRAVSAATLQVMQAHRQELIDTVRMISSHARAR
jgi:hypothetical protein